MRKKVLFAVGGTGGHVYPALALAQKLVKDIPDIDILFSGGKLASNRYFDKALFPYENIECGAFSFKNPIQLLQNLYANVRGLRQSVQILKRHKPALVVGFGSYHTFPLLLGAKLARVPFILHESNSIPGKVNRLMGRYALVTGIQFPETAKHMRGKTAEVGMPLRDGFKKGTHSVEISRHYFGLPLDRTTLLIFGGSQGAQAMNKLAVEAICRGRFQNKLQVLHFTGSQAAAESYAAAYKESRIEACVKDFEPRMDFAWQAADFALSRAGAGTIAEAMEFEVPPLLVPFPHAADRHQEKNGAFLARQVGGAQMHLEHTLNADLLEKILADCLEAGCLKLCTMRQAIQDYKKNVQPQDFCSLIENLLKERD